MIGSLLGTIGLSLCLSLPSFAPRKHEVISNIASAGGSYSFSYVDRGQGNLEYVISSPFGNASNVFEPDSDYNVFFPSNNDYSLEVYISFTSDDGTARFIWYFDTSAHASSFFSDYVEGMPTYSDDYGEFEIEESYAEGSNVYLQFYAGQLSQGSAIQFSFNIPVTTYSVSANYVNCSHTSQSGEKYLPTSPYDSSDLSNPYVFRVDASTGCRFRKDGSAVSVAGGITINSILYDGLPASVGSDYATWIAIELNLPLADCSITFNAINQFAVNKNLDACTTTIPDVYSVGMTGTYRIEALSGYAFDSNLTQYTITGIVVNSVAYADNIYGNLYRTIVLDLSFPATNYANVIATASPYSADYAQGFRDGESSGLELKGGLMDLIPNVFASIGAFFFTFSGVNFMGINLLAVVGIVVSVGLIGVVIKVALK